MKYILCVLILLCGVNVGLAQQPSEIVVVRPPVVCQPYYTVRYVPVVKQEVVMVPVVENNVFYYYYPTTRWVPQPVPWTPDPYTEWLRCRHSNYRY